MAASRTMGLGLIVTPGFCPPPEGVDVGADGLDAEVPKIRLQARFTPSLGYLYAFKIARATAGVASISVRLS